MPYRLKRRPIYEYRCSKQCPYGRKCMIFKSLDANINLSKGIYIKCPVEKGEMLVQVKPVLE